MKASNSLLSVARRYYKNAVFNLKNSDKIYLTFDDGPTPDVTSWVLDLLKVYNAKATFFCLGKNVSNNPILFSRIVNEGHRVGNHTQSHLNGWNTRTDLYLADIKKAEKSISSNLFRPPYGKIRKKQFNAVSKEFKVVFWNILSEDYDVKVTPDKIVKNVCQNLEPGSVVVFHDSLKASKNLKQALPKILSFINQKGLDLDVIS